MAIKGSINVSFNNKEDNQDPRQFDFAHAISALENENTFKESGLSEIVSIIENELGNRSSSIFVEFNLIGTILDPRTPSQLASLSYIKDTTGDKSFKSKVESKSASIINAFLTDNGYTLFFHPDIFVNQSVPQVQYSILNDGDAKNGPKIPEIENLKTVHADALFKDIPGKENCYYRLSRFNRSYDDIIVKTCDLRYKNVIEETSLFHMYYQYNFSNDNSSAFIVIPILGAKSSNSAILDYDKDSCQGQGVVFIYYEINPAYKKQVEEGALKDCEERAKRDANYNKEEIRSGYIKTSIDKCLSEQTETISNTLFKKLGDVVRLVSYNYLFNVGLQLSHQVQKEAIKSAKAAIMSRNMSHNLGSHVMAYLKQKLASVADILRSDNDVLYNLYPERTNYPVKDEIELPFLVGLGRFIGYLQERQDYIATISTDYIPYGAPVNLKDAIYDEINPDLRYMRHHEDGNRNRPFNILLNYIAKSEGLSRENMGRDESGKPYSRKDDEFKTKNDILFGFVKYSGQEDKHVFGLNNLNGSQDEALMLMRGINFSLPGGLIGRQAVFSIFENLIRNAAKHEHSSSGENLEFTLDVIDGAELLEDKVCQLEKRICDKGWVKKYKNSSDISDLFILSITDNRISDKTLVDKIKKALYEPFVDQYGSMLTANKGIKEMRISAAWLRGDTEEANYLTYFDEENNPNQKKAPLVAVERNLDRHLRYLICIKKNRLVAVIQNGLNESDVKIFNSISERNRVDWTVFDDEEEFLKNNNGSYSYIVVANESVLTEIRPKTSNRVCIWSISDTEREELTNDFSGERTFIKILQKYTGINETFPSIYIWDGKTADSPTSKQSFWKVEVSSYEKSINDAQYIYRTHHANEKEFGEYWEAKNSGDYKKVKFVEGITGDNSSDRLIRREPLNERWYYSHLYAMKMRVAIIDERLFKIIHNIDETSFISGDKKITEAISRLNNGEEISKVKKYLYDLESLSFEDTELILPIKDREELIEFLRPREMKFKEIVSSNYLSAVYSEKGIDIFTMIQDENQNLVLVGCVANDYSTTSKYKNTFKKIAIFPKEGEEISFTVCNDVNLNKYNYLSIHQGILDKIYEYFDIKDYAPENDRKKIEVTSKINNIFLKNSPIGPDFIPGFIIHSGRAKPTKEDMPQKLPFIQYAALENAVKDSKFSLVELLDFARYE